MYMYVCMYVCMYVYICVYVNSEIQGISGIMPMIRNTSATSTLYLAEYCVELNCAEYSWLFWDGGLLHCH